MPKIPFDKPALAISQQIVLLQDKGLAIENLPSAEHWLSHISYFRFKHYSYSFKDYKEAEGNYLPGTTFEAVRDLYLFDRKLKMLVFEALENIEIAVKTQVSNIMGVSHGAHWYLNAGLFLSEEDRRQLQRNATFENIPKLFDYAEFIQDIEYNMEFPTELFLQHYRDTYEPIYPPTWMMMETITFGTLSLLFENLKASPEKTAIIEHFKLTKRQFVSWLHCFSFIRNKCAHHARLVYSKINFAPALPQRKTRQFLNEADLVENDTLYAVLCCIQFMLNVCNNASSFRKHLVALVNEYPTIDYVKLGFTEHWREEELWSIS